MAIEDLKIRKIQMKTMRISGLKSYGSWISGLKRLGFIVGFWIVFGSLMIKKSWRHAYFPFVDEKKDRLFVTIKVNMARLQRKIEA